MTKGLPPAKIIGHVDPKSVIQKRVDRWNKEAHPTISDLVDLALEAVMNSNEIGHRVNVKLIPEAMLAYDSTTRVWKINE